MRTSRGGGRPDEALHNIHPQEPLAQCLTAAADRVTLWTGGGMGTATIAERI